MVEKEKLELLKDILIAHADTIEFISQSDAADYVECIQLFLSSTDQIIQEGSLATCYLIIQKTKKLHSLK